MKPGPHCFKRNDDVFYKEIDGALYLVDTYRRAFMQINQVGAEIWQLLDGTNPFCNIIAELREKFEIDEKALEKDVLFFIRALKERELVT